MGTSESVLLAKQLGIPLWSGHPSSIREETLRQVPYPFVRKHLVLPVHEDGDTVWVAISNVAKSGALEELSILLQRPLHPVLCEEESLVERIEMRYRPGQQAVSQTLDLQQKSEAQPHPDEVDLLEEREDSPAVRLLNSILAESIREGASDVHFDPTDLGLRVRFRIDGVLLEKHSPSRELVGPLVTRLKVMSKLDIAEHRLPQDGRLRVRVAGRETDFRVSTIPCLGGERLVLRVLDKSHVQLGLSHLHLPEKALMGLKRALGRSEGLILVTGPTGSGKTTTLYSAVKEILSSERNLMTIEDPIEVRLPGIAQIQVQPKIGFSFASGLRHILRQDPDVILVGEIRDSETAQIAVQAALTGHLVLSTLHTNDAPSAIARLIEMGVEPYLVGSSLLGVLAQRLVRKICEGCREAFQPSHFQLAEWGMSAIQNAHHGAGCERCQGSGYQGRLGLYEWMPITASLQAVLLRIHDAATLKRHALAEGLEPLRLHGLRLAAAGWTSLPEVARVTAPEEDACPPLHFAE
jgi:general secretion pathway protein E